MNTSNSNDSGARKQVLFASSESGNWMDRDESILRELYDVKRIYLSYNGYLHFWSFLKRLSTSEFIFIWFGSFRALPLILMAKLFRRRILIVAGGFDVAKLDRFHHGAFSRGIVSRTLRRLLFGLADTVLCVSESNYREAQKNGRIPADKLKLVRLGFKPLIPAEQLRRWSERQNQVVYISSAMHDPYYQIKGLDQLVEVAALCPEVEFVHFGKLSANIETMIRARGLKNLTLKGYVPYASPDFLDCLNSSKIILQLSAYESFGAAIVDGALCGCYPITSDSFALKELTRECGGCVPYGEPELAAAKIHEVLHGHHDSGEIAGSFQKTCDFERRRRLLLDMFLRTDGGFRAPAEVCAGSEGVNRLCSEGQ